jgi:tetratricopeptide (TPR) repeat protein
MGSIMPLKKKTPMSKSAEKRNVPEVPRSEENRNGLPARRAATAGKAGSGESASAPGPSQMESFEEGMRLFHARQFQRARDSFMPAMHGPDRAVAHRAGLHVRMCEARLESPGVVLNTPEEHYNYAVTLINSRDLTAAQKHLRSALEADPSADHVLYALAACQCLGGDLQPAYENLKRAIDLQPRNRLAARQDPDFAAMADHQAFARLLYPDRK